MSDTQGMLKYTELLVTAIRQDCASFAWLGTFDSIRSELTDQNFIGNGGMHGNELLKLFNQYANKSESILSRLVKQKTSVTIENMVKSQENELLLSLFERANWQSAAFFPIIEQQNIVAVLALFSENAEAFGREFTDRFDLMLTDIYHHSEQKKQAITSPSDSVKLLTNVFDRIHDGIVALDNDWHYTYVNQRAANMLQRQNPQQLIGKNIWQEFPDGIGEPFHQAYLKAVATQSPITFEQYYSPWDLWFENRVYPSKSGLTIYFTEITERKKNEEKLARMAHYDELTGLPNRVLLFLRMDHGIASAKRDKHSLALLMIDLDHFKTINDSYGHDAGDRLLRIVADRLKQRFRSIDTICRLGGDEFTILLEKISSSQEAANIAKEVITILRQPVKLFDNIVVQVGGSIGISLYPEHGQSKESLLQHADTSLYEAKLKGRGSYKFYDQQLTATIRSEVEIESRLREAIKRGELTAYYQPQIDIITEQVIGAEALVRWLDPKFGVVMPNAFISVAEKTGLIVEIGNLVLLQCCYQAKQWIDAYKISMQFSVNLSAQQFLHTDIVAIVTSALETTKLPAKYLKLEITESAVMQREDEAIVILHELRDMGIGIAIDDFGTGYSSLSYLKKFPLDVLKIDKSFIDDIPLSSHDMAITAMIVAMSKTLNLQVIAEGVETEQQLTFLKQQQCDAYQGFLKSPAVSADEFEARFIHTKK